MIKTAPLLVCLALFFSGCASVDNFGSSLKYNIQGEYYLQKKKYPQGIEKFRQAVENDPNNAEAHYYYGRFLLAENKAEKALPSLKQAAALSPDKSEYHFWLGVALGETGQVRQERLSYRKTLEIDPENIQALTYMGNNLLRAGKDKEALEYYQKTLSLWPSSPQALYNRAVILRKQGRTQEEKRAWLQYLDAHPAGGFARVAADRLNILGDQSYRNHRLGLRTVTLAEIDFVSSTGQLSPSAYPSLDLVGATVANMVKGTLNIVVYQRNNLTLAKKRAQSIRNYLTQRYPDLNYPDLKTGKRIRISWFDTAEIRTVLRKKLSHDESVQFFLTDFRESKKSSRKK